MEKHDIIRINTQDSLLTLQELCEICEISPAIMNDLIAWEIIHPHKITQGQWQFNLSELYRIKMALRLQHDLEVNLSGVALILELLDELKELREQTKILDKHFLHR